MLPTPPFSVLAGTMSLAILLELAAVTAAQGAGSPACSAAAKLEEDLAGVMRRFGVLRELVTREQSRSNQLIESMTERVKRDQRLQGGYYRFQANKRLLKEYELQRGIVQLRRMLKDRPEMARGLTEDDELFQWAARKFAGEDLPTWVKWQNTSDITDFDAWHRVPGHNTPGLIFVGKVHGPQSGEREGRLLSFEELWLRAAYEMHNIQSQRESHELWNQAMAGTITREEYILGCARLEYGAWLRTRVFFIDIYYPWAKKRGLKTTERWWLNVPDTFDKWIAHYPRESLYPWRYFGSGYDDATVYRELRGTSVNWRKLKRRGGEAWEKFKSEILQRQRVRQLWNMLAVGT
jgi:hypothetical protein